MRRRTSRSASGRSGRPGWGRHAPTADARWVGEGGGWCVMPSRPCIEKRAEYALGGIPEYWIVDPDARDVLVLRLDGPSNAYAEAGRFAGDDGVTALAAPDVLIRVADMFA